MTTEADDFSADRESILAFEGECVKVLRERLAVEARLEPSAREIIEVALLGWYPKTRLVVTVRRRDEEQRWDWPLWGEDALALGLAPGPGGRDAGAVQVCTSILLTHLEEPPWR